MAAERRQTGAEPSSADGGQALGWMAGFEGSSLLGRKWISERHNGSLRRVCSALLKPCLLCPGSFMPSGACGRQLLHAAFLIAAASPALAAAAAARHPSKAGINLQHGAVVQFCHMRPLVELILRAAKPSPSVFGGGDGGVGNGERGVVWAGLEVLQGRSVIAGINMKQRDVFGRCESTTQD